jgi:hypothetical protein
MTHMLETINGNAETAVKDSLRKWHLILNRLPTNSSNYLLIFNSLSELIRRRKQKIHSALKHEIPVLEMKSVKEVNEKSEGFFKNLVRNAIFKFKKNSWDVEWEREQVRFRKTQALKFIIRKEDELDRSRKRELLIRLIKSKLQFNDNVCNLKRLLELAECRLQERIKHLFIERLERKNRICQKLGQLELAIRQNNEAKEAFAVKKLEEEAFRKKLLANKLQNLAQRVQHYNARINLDLEEWAWIMLNRRKKPFDLKGFLKRKEEKYHACVRYALNNYLKLWKAKVDNMITRDKVKGLE